jgi:hypothetical protein
MLILHGDPHTVAAAPFISLLDEYIESEDSHGGDYDKYCLLGCDVV